LYFYQAYFISSSSFSKFLTTKKAHSDYLVEMRLFVKAAVG